MKTNPFLSVQEMSDLFLEGCFFITSPKEATLTIPIFLSHFRLCRRSA